MKSIRLNIENRNYFNEELITVLLRLKMTLREYENQELQRAQIYSEIEQIKLMIHQTSKILPHTMEYEIRIRRLEFNLFRFEELDEQKAMILYLIPHLTKMQEELK